jgi:hypothetical protein
MPRLPKITLSDLFKKRLKLVGYLVAFGFATYISKTYLNTNEGLSIVFGGAVNFILWEIEQQLKQEGVTEIIRMALKK